MNKFYPKALRALFAALFLSFSITITWAIPGTGRTGHVLFSAGPSTGFTGFDSTASTDIPFVSFPSGTKAINVCQYGFDIVAKSTGNVTLKVLGANGASSTQVPGYTVPGGDNNRFVQVVRAGTASVTEADFYSTDGSVFNLKSLAVYVNLAVTSDVATVTLTGYKSGVQVGSPVTQNNITPTSLAPLNWVNITANLNGIDEIAITVSDQTTPGNVVGDLGIDAIDLVGPSVTNPALSNAQVGASYTTENFTASGGTAPYTFAVTSGALPGGMSLSSAGALSGTPTAAGTFTFSVTATDANSEVSPASPATLTVSAPTMTLSPTTLSDGTYKSSYSSVTFSASGGTAPYTYTAVGLPPGMTINASSGVLSGTPTAAGTYAISVTATDNSTGTGAPFQTTNFITWVIDKVPLTISANAASKNYGAAIPALSVTYSGFASGDNSGSLTTAPTITTSATAASPVGTYPITASGAVDPNYAISYVPNTLTVNAVALTITPAPASMTYGGTVPAFTANYSGFVNGDNASSLTTAPTITTTATSTSVPGTYPITATGAVDPNYTIAYVAGTLTVGKAVLTVTGTSPTMTYGSAVPALGVIYSGFVGSDNASSLTTQPTSTTTATSASTVGAYAVTPSGGVAANYTFSYLPGSLTITPATLSVTPDPQTMTYGGTVPSPLTVSYSGFVNGDGPSVVTTAPTVTTTATSASSVGTYPITASGAAATNYVFTYNTGTLTIGPAGLTITPAPASMTYGGTVPAFTANYSGFVNGDNASSLTTAPTITTTATSSSVPGTYPITASGAVDPNYTISYSPGTLTVGKAVLTVTGTSPTMTYGGAVPALGVIYSGFVGSDNASSLTTQPTSTTTATSASAVGAYPVTPSGGVAANYTFNYLPGSLTITPATLTVTPTDQTMSYGGTVPSPLTVGYSGFVNGDGPSVVTTAPTVTTTGTSASSVGTYPITASGAAATNYTFTYNTGTLTISPVGLTITPVNASMAYGGTVPAFTANYTGFVNGDNASSLTIQPTLSTAATSTSVPGTYPITASGAVDPNYTITYNTGTLTVGKAVLTITGANTTMTYGSAVPALSVTYSGFVGSDNASSLTTLPTVTTTATSISPVGTYPITASGAAAANYTFAYLPGTLTVQRATVTVTPNNASMTYGGTVPSLSVSYTGFVNGEGSGVLTSIPTATTTATSTSPAGTYPITASGAAAANYTFTYNTGTLTVSPAVLTVTANNATMVYGEAFPALSVTYSGFVNGDNVSSLTTQPVETVPATPFSPVGAYTITPSGAVDPNYTFNYVTGTLTITPAPLTITANNASMVYGSAVPAMTASYSGFVNGDNASNLTIQPVLSTTATSASPVGTYPITASGAVDPNYTISYVGATMTVTKAVLTATADNKIMPLGGPLPTLTITYTGFVNGDNVSSLTSPCIATTPANAGSPSGTYIIGVANGSSPNYTFHYVNGTLTVQKAILTITANNASSTYGSPLVPNGSLTVSYSGFINGDNSSSLTVPPTVINTAFVGAPAGTYALIPSGAVDPNYTIVYVDGTYSINQATLLITAVNESKTYGNANPALIANYTGFVNGDGPASLSTFPTLTTSATTASPVGNYPIAGSGAVDPNYIINYTPGVMTVNPAALTVTANSTSMTYGGTVPALSASYSGFVNGDNASSLTIQPVVSTSANSTVPIGTYPITASGAVDPNYTITYVPGVMTVGQAVLTVTPNNASMTYGGTVPALSVSYSGFVNGDNPASLTAPATAATTATSASPAGTYPITASGAIASNYAIVYNTGTLTVGKAALTVTADNASMTYGGTLPALNVTYSGFVNGDNASKLTVAPTVATTATSASPVGTYPITPSGAVDPNYTITYNAGILTIGKAALTVTADNESMTYGGTVPALPVTYSGFVNGDNASSLTTQPVVSTTATSASGVGTYPITPSGAADANYTITYVPGTLTVQQATVTITANNQSRYFLLPNPPLTVSYSGFVNGDNSAVLTTKPTVTTTANLLSLPGTYPITASGAVATNYTFTYIPGVLTVEALLPNVITFAALPVKTYGDADFTITVTASSGLPVTLTSSNTAVATVTPTGTGQWRVHIVSGGQVTMAATQAGGPPYAVATEVDQILTINPEAQSILFPSPLGGVPASGSVISLDATASSGLPVTYTVSDPTVATVSGSQLTFVGSGNVTITANQAGNNDYLPAPPVSIGLQVFDGKGFVQGVGVFPNPCHGTAYIRLSEGSIITKLAMFDLSGRLVLGMDQFGSSTNMIPLDVSHLLPGIYILRVVCVRDHQVVFPVFKVNVQ
ncbi:MBG domain-containing protein [Dinghuibacter silviterrae]|uniref:Gliding motility-associated-like protein n=1 Tax=Dinghuibacter silviterrae TaxID=1539049 RepID=A0A4R8DUD6_9BACT|nr:MBG domain-containing protein [Dinghuibacter silviterrae]TDX01980.1 hypothetical protein EDB95_3027 [Dinghuibacter silviterrae]